MKKRLLSIIEWIRIIFGGIFLILMLAGLAYVSFFGFQNPFSGVPLKNPFFGSEVDLSKLDKEDYIGVVVPKCEKDESSEFCKCFYNSIIDEIGVKSTYDLDYPSGNEASSANKQKAANISNKCRGN